MSLLPLDTFFCPSETREDLPQTGNIGYNHTALGGGKDKYSNGGAANPVSPKKTIQCLEPSNQFTYMDTNAAVVYPYPTNTEGYKPAIRHNGGKALNILMADGHATNWAINDPLDPYGAKYKTAHSSGYLGKWDWVNGGVPSVSNWFKFSSRE